MSSAGIQVKEMLVRASFEYFDYQGVDGMHFNIISLSFVDFLQLQKLVRGLKQHRIWPQTF